LDLHGLTHIVGSHEMAHAYVELVGPMPKQGVVSTWRFEQRGRIVARYFFFTCQ
jgi:hypothetical protein